MKNLIKKMFAMALVCLASVSAFAIEPVDGVYQIGSAQDFKEFADLVNADGRQHQFHAVVTADFTVDGLTELPLRMSSLTRVARFTPLATLQVS